MKLYPHQQKLVEEIEQAWAEGAINVLLQAPTGLGKTVIFSDIIKREKFPCVAIAHRREIVGQISKTLAKNGVYHNIIAQKQTIRDIVAGHMDKFKRSYYTPQAQCSVAGVDTLVKMDPDKDPWFKKVKLVVQDEAHHVLKKNKWGTAAAMFPNARGLYPTATPERADGCGLGRHADGLIDVMVIGPPMRELITQGFLSEYGICAPKCSIDLGNVPLSPGGDYSPPKLRNAVHKAKITGDVVKHYLKFAKGKLGITFAVDIESATEIAAAYRAAGVPAEVITSKTPELLRASIMRKFENREILQIVNVDLLGEGFDVPAVEVVSMVRPTQSYAVFVQQFGRALRFMKDKKEALIIDHVDNYIRHKVPDYPRVWSLDRRERRRSTPDDVIAVRSCLNPECMRVYERIHRVCPYCKFYPEPVARSAPKFVDGDLIELDAETLAALRGEIQRIDDAPKVPHWTAPHIKKSIMKKHRERQIAQANLRSAIALWAGYQVSLDREDSEIYRRFYFDFHIDVASAQALGATPADELNSRIQEILTTEGVIEA